LASGGAYAPDGPSRHSGRCRAGLVRSLIVDAIDVVENMYIPDLLAVASFYPEWTG